MTDARPIIGITMGDPAGVGAEIIVKSFDSDQLHDQCRALVFGDAIRLQEACEIVGSDQEIRAIHTPDEAKYERGVIDCLDLKVVGKGVEFGRVQSICGEAAYRYVERAAQAALAGEIGAICTAPLNKEALQKAGHMFPGHTELLAHLCGVDEVSMMLTAPGLRVIHVTVHLGLIDAINKIEPGLVFRTLERAQVTLNKIGIDHPRIAVCGINPHAGENGLFGNREEETKLVPAIEKAQAMGWDVIGPLPADTLFFRAVRGDFDIVVAMYHDQGHCPVKVLGIESGVNITVGLPVIRTSVDHGTAFDIAGTGKADERSLLEALRQAAELASKV